LNFRVIVAVTVIFAIFGTSSAFAQSTHTINIPTGAADPNAQYFWQVKSTGNTDGELTIQVMDSIRWANADTAAHTVTSGTPADGPDGIFDSSLYPPGSSFNFQFREAGTYDYFCIVHPWMIGVVNVVEEMPLEIKRIHNVGQEVDEEGQGYDIAYYLDRKLTSATVDSTRKTVTFNLVGQIEDDKLVVHLPSGLIKNPNSVWIDDQQITDFESVTNEDMTILGIPLEMDTEEVIIMGTAVVPEFGTTVIILFVSVLLIVLITQSKKMNFPTLSTQS